MVSLWEAGVAWYNIAMFRRSKTQSIDGMKNAHQEKAKVGFLTTKTLLKAEETAPVAQPTAEASELALADERRERQIINYFTAAERVIVTPEEIVGLDSRGLKNLKRMRERHLRQEALAVDSLVDAEQRQKFERRLAQDELTADEETEFYLSIESPLEMDDGATKLFEQIERDDAARVLKQILAVAAGYSVKNPEKVDKTALVRLLTTVQPDGSDYRTPVGWVKAQGHWTKDVAEQELLPYVPQLMNLLYGERMAYYKVLEGMKQTAREQVARPNAKLSPASYANGRIAPEQGNEMLGRAMIDGDAWRGNGGQQYLSTHNLAEAGLVPIHEVRLSDGRIALSKLFQVPGVGVAVLAYVYAGQGMKVRGFYRQSGQLLWRYLPGYIRRADGRLGRMLEGFSAESVILPLELQETLARLEQQDGAKVLAQGGIMLDPEFFLLGTAQVYENLQEYQAAWNYGRIKGDYYREVASEPINQDFGMYDGGNKKAPYILAIDAGRAPDFQQQLVRFSVNTAELGPVELRGYKSQDGQYAWLMANDRRGRVWVPQVEVLSPLTSLGVRRDWAEMGDLATALYEPTARAGIYGDRSDTKGAKQCMWPNYLRNVPLIQEYVKFRKRG